MSEASDKLCLKLAMAPGKKIYRYPFDEVCVQILAELKKRNWKAPGVRVEFDSDGAVDSVFGGNFSIWYARGGKSLVGYAVQSNEFPALITIPNKCLEVSNDESGPTFYLYVGGDWRKDRKKFMFGKRFHTKYDGRPKFYLLYQGTCRCAEMPTHNHSHDGKRTPLLWTDNDCHREYDPEGDEPTFFSTESVFWDFTQYLRDVVLSKIVHSPLPS